LPRARATGTLGGVAFENKDGSFTFKLDVFPQTKFQLREEKPLVKEEAAAE